MCKQRHPCFSACCMQCNILYYPGFSRAARSHAHTRFTQVGPHCRSKQNAWFVSTNMRASSEMHSANKLGAGPQNPHERSTTLLIPAVIRCNTSIHRQIAAIPRRYWYFKYGIDKNSSTNNTANNDNPKKSSNSIGSSFHSTHSPFQRFENHFRAELRRCPRQALEYENK